MKKRNTLLGIIGRIILFGIGFTIILFIVDMLNIKIVGIVLSFSVYILFAIIQYLLRNKNKMIRFFNTLIAAVSLILAISLANVHPDYLNAINNPKNKTEIVHLLNGDIEGVVDFNDEVEIYTGIPYAKPPVGDLRWREPQDVENWEGVRDCSMFAPKAMQAKYNPLMSSIQDVYLEKTWNIHLMPEDVQNMSEDCLYLNIYKPKNADVNTPVFVFFHGGSLTSGSTAFSDYNGIEYARRGVIFVQVAYRLGIFGYLALDELKEESINNTTGNYGLLDQIKSLEWINKNIDKFNGDKDNVTIGGESAGSSSVSALCSSPLAKGFFKKAVGESSSTVLKNPPHTFRSLEDAMKMGEDIKKEFDVTSLAELRKIDADRLVTTKYQNSQMTVDGYALTKTPYEVYKANEQNEEALLNGCNLNEADCFIVPQYLLSLQALPNLKNYKERLESIFGDKTNELLSLYGEITTDEEAYKVFNEIVSTYWFVYPHESWSTLANANNVKVYRYLFTKENGYLSTWHSGEMIYLYHNIENSKRPYRYNDSDIELSNMMSSYLINFIKTGNPNGADLPTWTMWTEENNKIFEFGENKGMIDDPFSFLYEFMKNYDEA